MKLKRFTTLIYIFWLFIVIFIDSLTKLPLVILNKKKLTVGYCFNCGKCNTANFEFTGWMLIQNMQHEMLQTAKQHNKRQTKISTIMKNSKNNEIMY